MISGAEHLFMHGLNIFFRKMSVRPLAHCFPLENGDGDKNGFLLMYELLYRH